MTTGGIAESDSRGDRVRTLVFGELGVHLLLLATSAGAALAVWSRSEPTLDFHRGDVVIWNADPNDIQRVVFEAPKQTTTIEVKRDAVGTYYLGKFDIMILPGEEIPSPTHDSTFLNDTDKPQLFAQTFVSTKAGDKLFKDLAPLKALLAVGRVPKNQLAEFGLAAPERRAIVKFKNGERRLEYGDETLGEKHQYVLDPQTGQVYVLLGDLARDISEADVRLPDRELHAWDPSVPTAAHITGSLGDRNLVRAGPKTNQFWADAAHPNDKDATATNWMAKIDQLRPEFFDPSAGVRNALLRIEYTIGDSQLGFLELLKGPESKEGVAEYWLRTEQTRLPSKVLIETGVQIEQDAKSVVK